MDIIASLAKKYSALKSSLSERARRLWAGTEADAIGRGGVAWVARATGLAISTVRKGRDEVRSGETPKLVRDRRPGGGRSRLEKRDPGLMKALDALVSPTARGDPESPLRWTCKSLRNLARELKDKKHEASPSTLGQLLHHLGYSLQANVKTKEGSTHSDRDAQFNFINDKAADFIARDQPVISVDSKKKELIGEHANRGQEWQPKGKAIEVLTHDFFDPTTPTATPYGVYDVVDNSGFVNVGTDHNTPTFAVRSVEKWWERMGAARYPKAKELFITADAGGSNSWRARLWKLKLQEVADRTGLTIHVSHFPPGTSKWNKIEHRLFSFISINWRGQPLTTYDTIVQLISGTTTSKGLRVRAELDDSKYALGVRATEKVMDAVRLQRSTFHGEWNYSLAPRSKEQLAVASKAATTPRQIGAHAERRAYWVTQFALQRESGLGHKVFCRRNGVNYGTYRHQRQKLIGPMHGPSTNGVRPDTQAKWSVLFAEQARTGLSHRAFCMNRGINYNSYIGKRRLIAGAIRPTGPRAK